MAAAAPSIRFLFGLEDRVKRNVIFIDENTVVFPCGHSVVIYNVENKSQEFLHSAPGVNKITALAVSNNKKYLAVAELAEYATISIYDIEKRRKKRELKQPSVDGTPGVEIVALDFSQDGKILLAQGGAPMWTCVLWAWEKNKPVSQVNVHSESSKTIATASFHPLDHTLVCCSGKGILRFYRIVDNMFKAMPSSVGKHDPQNFLAHAFLRDKDELLIAATDTGELILFENNDWKMVIPTSPAEGKGIFCVAPFSKGFLCGCEDGLVRMYTKSDDRMEMFTLGSTFCIKDSVESRVTNITVSPSEDHLLCSTDTKQMFALGLSDTEIMQAEDMKFHHLITPFHEPNSERVAEITGMDVCVRKQLVATCGVDRSVRIWNYGEQCVEIQKKFDEAPQSVAFHPNGLQIIVGFSDKLRIMDLLMDDLAMIREFAISGCEECSYSTGGHMIAAAQGSMVQIINSYTCNTLHTLRGLKGKVMSLAWSSDDKLLFTASADGSIVRWDLQTGDKTGDYFNDSGFLMEDTYNWNCIVVDPNSNDDVILATGRLADSAVAKSALVQIKFSTGSTQPQLLRQIKLGFYSKCLVVSPRFQSVLVGSFEAPAAIHSAPYPLPENDVHFSKLYAHRQGIVGMSLSPDTGTLFSTSLDGCFAIINVGPGAELDDGSSGSKDLDDVAGGESGFSRDILVRHTQILQSNKETEKLNEKVAELKMYNEYQLRLKGLRHTEKLEQLQERMEDTLHTELEKIRKLGALKEHTRVRHLEKLSSVRDRHADEIENMDVSYKRKIELEKDRFAQLLKEKEEIQAQWEKENAEYIDTHKRAVAEIKQKYNELLEDEKAARERSVQEKEIRAKHFVQDTELMEQDAAAEIDDLKKHYESQLIAEREATLRLKGENILMKNKHESLLQDIADQKEEIKALVKKETERYAQIDRLDKEIVSRTKEIEEREKTIREKDRRIYELKKKNQELEKFKFVLDYKIKELKRQVCGQHVHCLVRICTFVRVSVADRDGVARRSSRGQMRLRNSRNRPWKWNRS